MGDQSLTKCKDFGELYAWGHNHVGQLGLGYASDRYTPTLVTSNITFVQVAAGTIYSLGITGTKR